MAEEKFAFESEEVSIAFTILPGLGDCVMAKKVFDALIELVPDCQIDIFCENDNHIACAKSFYGMSKNLNKILLAAGFYNEHYQKYDLATFISGGNFIGFHWINVPRLSAMSPKLLESLSKINQYNQENVVGHSPWTVIPFRNMALARILHKSCFEFLAYDGALPIRDEKVNIPLNPAFKTQFDELKLGKYITFYTDIGEREKEKPKVKTWPIRYWYEYVARMKKRFPSVEIIQCGGGDVSIGNADRHFLGCHLELTKYILANSLLNVGCEGGLTHLATAMGTKCLVFFGPSGADYYGYDSNINLVSEICQPCMYMFPDHATCLRGAKEPPCMLSHTPQTVCEITCNYLKNKA